MSEVAHRTFADILGTAEVERLTALAEYRARNNQPVTDMQSTVLRRLVIRDTAAAAALDKEAGAPAG